MKKFFPLFIFFILSLISVVSPSAPKIHCNVGGEVFELNSTPIERIENVQMIVTNTRTSDVLSTFTDAGGFWVVDLKEMPNGYQDGDPIRINATFDNSFNTTSITVRVREEEECYHMRANLWLDTLPPYFTKPLPRNFATSTPLSPFVSSILEWEWTLLR
jgi:hypothetical protein